MVTIAVRKVMVETWQPRPEVRSSKRSGPRAHIYLKRMGASRGKALDSGSMGRGKHVEDWLWCLAKVTYLMIRSENRQQSQSSSLTAARR